MVSPTFAFTPAFNTWAHWCLVSYDDNSDGQVRWADRKRLWTAGFKRALLEAPQERGRREPTACFFAIFTDDAAPLQICNFSVLGLREVS